MLRISPALLALADGTVFNGKSIGYHGFSIGEIVFNTAMTGYQEILTDPSYAEQIVTLTYPHIGNVGTNNLDNEADTIFAKGLVIRDASLLMSSWRGTKTLSDFLIDNKIIGIADIDTRYLTQLLREKGAQGACLMAGENIDEALAIEKAQNFSGLKNTDLAKKVSTSEIYTWNNTGERSLDGNTYPVVDLKSQALAAGDAPLSVVAYDFGIKQNIIRMLSNRGCSVTIVPAQTSIHEVLEMHPDGVFLSNGPGDPAPCDYAIEATKILIEKQIPLFGICLGMQILSLAAGANTTKMKFGHHGANHPVECVKTKRVYITSQNHGFAVDEKTLPDHVTITHTSLFDGSLQGVELKNAPAFGFQGHPEASPGPHDINNLFDRFIELMTTSKNKKLESDNA